MTKFLKEFLKPNRWKVGIWIIITVFANIFGITTSARGTILGHEPPTIFVAVHNPVLFPFKEFLWYDAGFLGLMESMDVYIAGLPLLLFLFYIIYWYLFACLIYFIFTKIKGVFANK